MKVQLLFMGMLLIMLTGCSDDNLTGDTGKESDNLYDNNLNENDDIKPGENDDVKPGTESGNTGAGESWDMVLAVDNQFDVYFGTPWNTEGEIVGEGTKWKKEYKFKAYDKKPTDYLYIATTSDQGGAQGFIGTFTNISRNKTVVTGDKVWEVFAAGGYEETNPYWPEPWPESLLPTQEQVDHAITFAQENNLWIKPFYNKSFDNDPLTDPTVDTPWSWNPWKHHYDNIPDNALWIWNDAGAKKDGKIPGPFIGGNNNEFLIFRVVGTAEITID